MIPLSALRQMLAEYDGWTYALDGDCRYSVQFADWCDPPPPTQTDCVAYVAGVVLGACHRAEILVDWPLARHEQAMIARPEQHDALARARAGGSHTGDRHLFGPCDALVAAGLADLVTTRVPPSWSVVQGWSSGWRHGHAVLIGEVNGRTIEVHEASKKEGRVLTRTARWPLAWTHQRVVALRVDAEA